ncbi:MAG: alpha-E domain-containing protein [Actinomycetota bacterium]|nr:alpha-E domain-containing protein [Actinomycetota bacterium]
MTSRGSIVLARTAESLYWLGRYMERSESMARILDVHLHEIIGTTDDNEARWSDQISAIFTYERDYSSFEDLALGLSLDGSVTSSIRHSIERAYENAKSARDAISLEYWELINVAFGRVSRYSLDQFGHGLFTFYSIIKERCAQGRGLAVSTMNRDAAWHFLNLGYNVEQLDILLRLLIEKRRSEYPEDWVAVLRSIGGHEAFLRATNAPVNELGALNFLIHEKIFPRTILASMLRISNILNELIRGLDESQGLLLPPELPREIARLEHPLATEVGEVDQLLEELWSCHLLMCNFYYETFFSPLSQSNFNYPLRSEVWR